MEEYLSEKEQWEWVKTQVRDNGPAVLLAVLLALAAVFGWRWWQGHLDQRRLAAGARYTQMIEALEAGDRSRALVALGELERDYPGSPYTDQAKLLAARVYVDDGQLERAASELADVTQHSRDHELALVAQLRLARVQIAQGKPDSALATLGADAGKGAFAALYHEVRGDAYHAKGDSAQALREYREAQQVGSGSDAQLLGLKITDLAAAAPRAAAAATAQNPPPAR